VKSPSITLGERRPEGDAHADRGGRQMTDVDVVSHGSLKVSERPVNTGSFSLPSFLGTGTSPDPCPPVPVEAPS
jgi:hypothetical protein